MHPERTELEDAFVTMQDGTRLSATAEVEVAPPVPEPEKSYWEENGFQPDIARMCNDLEGEPEKFLFSANIRHILDVVNNVSSISDFDRYSVEQIQEMIQSLRNEVPRVERQVVSFISQLTSARAVRNENIDFI